jgi:hypothetical protein
MTAARREVELARWKHAVAAAQLWGQRPG